MFFCTELHMQCEPFGFRAITSNKKRYNDPRHVLGNTEGRGRWRSWNAHNERVTCLDGISIYRRDIRSLDEGTWVCDSVIDFVLKYYSLQAEKENQEEFCHQQRRRYLKQLIEEHKSSVLRRQCRNNNRNIV